MLFTDATRPRILSGVNNWSIVPRITTLTLSNNPLHTNSAADNQNTREKANPVMAIGRTFEEVIQKGIRMIGVGMHGFVANKEFFVEDLDKVLNEPTDRRIFYLAQALENGYTVDRLHVYQVKGIFQ